MSTKTDEPQTQIESIIGMLEHIAASEASLAALRTAQLLRDELDERSDAQCLSEKLQSDVTRLNSEELATATGDLVQTLVAKSTPDRTISFRRLFAYVFAIWLIFFLAIFAFFYFLPELFEAKRPRSQAEHIGMKEPKLRAIELVSTVQEEPKELVDSAGAMQVEKGDMDAPPSEVSAETESESEIETKAVSATETTKQPEHEAEATPNAAALSSEEAAGVETGERPDSEQPIGEEEDDKPQSIETATVAEAAGTHEASSSSDTGDDVTLSTFLQSLGTLGDSFNILTALFAALAFAGALYSVILQSKELRLQREEMAMTRKELARSADAQSRSDESLKQQAAISGLHYLSLHYRSYQEELSDKPLENEMAKGKVHGHAQMLERTLGQTGVFARESEARFERSRAVHVTNIAANARRKFAEDETDLNDPKSPIGPLHEIVFDAAKELASLEAFVIQSFDARNAVTNVHNRMYRIIYETDIPLEASLEERRAISINDAKALFTEIDAVAKAMEHA